MKRETLREEISQGPSPDLAAIHSLEGQVGSIRGSIVLSPGIPKKTYYWLSGSIANGAFFNFLGMFLLYYYNQILGLSAVLASLAIAISIGLDAISDPTIGYMSDRFKHRLGRRIPFMIIGVLPTSLAFLLLFTVKIGDTQTLLFIQMMVLISFLRVAHTLYNVPREALGLELHRDYQERNVLWSRSKIFDIFGIGLGIGPVLLFFLSEWKDVRGYTWSAVWLSIVFLCYAGHSTWRMRHVEIEYDLGEESSPKASLKQLIYELRSLVTNQSWLALFFSMVFFNITGGLNGGSYTYFNDYLWNWKPDDLALTGFITMPGGIAAAFYVMSVTRHFEDKKRLAISTAWVALITGPIFMGLKLIDMHFGTNYLPQTGDGAFSFLWWLFCINGFVQTFLWTIFGIFISSMFSDVVEEQESRTKSRSEALVFSANNFMHKLIAGVSVFAGGIMITWAGFDNVLTQAESELAVFKLSLVFIISQTIGIFLSILVLYYYEIDKTKHGQYLKQLGYHQKNESISNTNSNTD